MPNWKAPGPDILHGFWLKKITSLHQAMVTHVDDCIKTGDVSKLDGRKLNSSCTERCEKGECCW